MGNYLLLLILACPLMMVFMMRGHGGHGGGYADRADRGHAEEHTGHGHSDSSARGIDELRRQREKLDGEIEARLADETRVGGKGGSLIRLSTRQGLRPPRTVRPRRDARRELPAAPPRSLLPALPPAADQAADLVLAMALCGDASPPQRSAATSPTTRR